MKTVILSLLLLVSVRCFAGGGSEVGGGGNAVVCFDDEKIARMIRENHLEVPDSAISHVTKVETFDLYEAKKTKGVGEAYTPKVISIRENESSDAYLERISKRMEFSVPQVAEAIRTGSTTFPFKKIVREEHGLKKVDDTNEVGLIRSESCVLATVASQYTNYSGSHMHLDWRLYNHPKHSRLSRAVLLLHEFVYKAALDRGAQDSRDTRALVALAVTENVDVFELASSALVAFKNYESNMDYPNVLLTKVALSLLENAHKQNADFLTANQAALGRLMVETTRALRVLGLWKVNFKVVGHDKYGWPIPDPASREEYGDSCSELEECAAKLRFVLSELQILPFERDGFLYSSKLSGPLTAEQKLTAIELLNAVDRWIKARAEHVENGMRVTYGWLWAPYILNLPYMPVQDRQFLDAKIKEGMSQLYQDFFQGWYTTSERRETQRRFLDHEETSISLIAPWISFGTYFVEKHSSPYGVGAKYALQTLRPAYEGHYLVP